MKIAICDDEKIICHEIYKKLKEFNADYIIDLYYSGESILESKIIYDIIFLDIQMKGLNGIKTAELLRKNNNEEYIIFLSNHDEKMVEVFKVKAFRFLHKPIDQIAFREALLQAEYEILTREKIVIKEKEEVYLISKDHILYIEAFGDGSYIYTKNKIFENQNTLKYWLDIIGREHFFQVHKSYIVSLKYIKSFTNTDIKILSNFQDIPIARRRLNNFKKTFFEYVKKYSNSI